MSSGEHTNITYSFVKVEVKKSTAPQSWYADKIGKRIEVRKVTYSDDYGNVTGWSYELPSKGFEPKYTLSRYDVVEITKQDEALEKARGVKL